MSIIKKPFENKISKDFIFLSISLLLINFSIQAQDTSPGNEKQIHSVYLTSNTALRSNETNKLIFSQIVEDSKKGDSASLVITGNIVPKEGFPDKDNGRDKVKEDLQKNLLDLFKDFKGNVIFTPGYNEWQDDAPDNIDDLE